MLHITYRLLSVQQTNLLHETAEYFNESVALFTQRSISHVQDLLAICNPMVA